MNESGDSMQRRNGDISGGDKWAISDAAISR